MNHFCRFVFFLFLGLGTLGFQGSLSFASSACEPASDLKSGDHGRLANSERYYAYISGESRLSREEILNRLKNPRTYRPDTDVKIESELKESESGWVNTLSISVKPVFFLPSIQWKELWSTITNKAPNRAKVIFEKTEGTKFIRFFCGSFDLESLPGSKTTQIKIYEEIDADRRNDTHLWSSVQGSLKTLEAK